MTPWHEWEDYQAGMYSPSFTDEQVAASVELLSNYGRFLQAARETLRAWPNAARHNLRHIQDGHNAWIGQATCLFTHGAPSIATRLAWGKMSNTAQIRANKIAVRVREQWEATYEQASFGF